MASSKRKNTLARIRFRLLIWIAGLRTSDIHPSHMIF